MRATPSEPEKSPTSSFTADGASPQKLDLVLSRWAGRVCHAARQATFSALPRLASAALAMEAHALGARSLPRIFARDPDRLPPTLNDDLLELYARSELAMANRFGFFNETEAFETGIDWTPARSPAWRAELHAFDVALDLALTYRISGDMRFARHLRYLMASWIAAHPPGRAISWSPLPLSRRVRNWILAADLAREAFEADADFLQVFLASLAQQATFLAWLAHAWEDRRARLMASRALLLASRVFARGGSLGETAHALLAEALGQGATSYPDHPQPLRQFELAAACSDFVLCGGAGELRKDWLRALERLEGMLHPDGGMPLFGREPLPPADAVGTLFALGAATLGVPHWKALAGEFGILPTMLLGRQGRQRFQALPHEPWRAESRLGAGSGLFRLGGDKSSALLISAMAPTSVLDLQDLFSYELTVNGQRTVVDSGIAGTPGAGPQDDLTAALNHNVFLVEGIIPHCEPMPEIYNGRVEGQEGVLGLWLSRAWKDGRLPQWKGDSCLPPLRHQRGFFLLANRYWVILDRLTGIGASLVENLIHFYPAYSLDVQAGHVLARSGAATIVVYPVAACENGAACTARFKTHVEGCYVPVPGTRYPAPTLALEWSQVSLPGVFGYALDVGRPGAKTGCTAQLSKTEVELALGDIRLRLPLPGDELNGRGQAGLRES